MACQEYSWSQAHRQTISLVQSLPSDHLLDSMHADRPLHPRGQKFNANLRRALGLLKLIKSEWVENPPRLSLVILPKLSIS